MKLIGGSKTLRCPPRPDILTDVVVLEVFRAGKSRIRVAEVLALLESAS